MNAPNYLKIDLSQNDVRETLQTIFNDMTRIRVEAKSRAPDDVVKDEYMHLTYRLASTIESVASEKEFAKMQKLAEHINKDIIYYDPSHDKFWREKDKKLIDGLDSLLFSLRGDRFSGVDEKYHVFQALKFLGAKDEKDKQQIYDSIVPVSSNGVKFESSKLESLAGFFLGKTYDVEVNEDAVSVKGFHKVVDEKLFKMVQDMGFSKLDITVLKEFDRQGYEKMNESNLEKPKSKFDRIMAGFVKYTTPISYPLLGCMPEYIRDNLGERWDFNSDKAWDAGAWVEIIGGLGASITLSAVHNNGWNMIWGVYLGINTVAKGIQYSEENERWGSLHFVAALVPFEKKITKEKNYVHRVYKLNPKLYEIHPDENIAQFENAASLALPENAKESLKYVPENNHFTFGRKFEKFIKKNTEMSFISDKQNNREYSVIHQSIDGYMKCHYLIFEPEKTHLITKISKKDTGYKFIEQFNLNDSKAIEKIGADSVYTRLRSYESGKPVVDLEVSL